MREACVDISAEMLAEAAGVLQDGGIRILGSLRSPSPMTVRLHIASDALPDGCGAAVLSPVRIAFTTKTYGRQRLVRISDITLI